LQALLSIVDHFNADSENLLANSSVLRNRETGGVCKSLKMRGCVGGLYGIWLVPCIFNKIGENDEGN